MTDHNENKSYRQETNQESNNTPRNRNGTRKRRRSITPGVQKHLVNKKCNVKPMKIYEKSPEEPKQKKARGIGSCPICFAEFGTKPLTATKCGHVFCTACLKAALKKTKRASQVVDGNVSRVMVPVTFTKNGRTHTAHGFGGNKFQAKRAAAKLALKILDS